MYERFVELLHRKGVKVSDVSKATGIRSGSFTDWKMGRYTPKIDKLEKIAAYFGVPVEYLLTGEIKSGYYLDDETAKIAQEIFDSKELGILFDAARGSTPQDLKMAADFLRRLKGTNNDT